MTRTVLITGARGGIGLATLRRFSGEGWAVTAAVRSQASAEELNELLAKERVSVQVTCFDLSDRVSTDAAAAEIISRGVPDVVVNNAAIGAYGPVELTTDASIDAIMEINFIAPLRLMRAFAPHFRKRGNGVIVNISSGWGFSADPGQGLYAASKHALEAISEALFYELRPFGVRVAVVEPGLTATNIRDKTDVTPAYGPESPYWETLSRRLEFLESTIWKDGWAEDPKVVADAIYRAATVSATPLFTPVGRDTKMSAQVRGRDTLDSYEARSNRAALELASRERASQV